MINRKASKKHCVVELLTTNEDRENFARYFQVSTDYLLDLEDEYGNKK